MPTNLKKFTVILDPEEDGGYSVYCPVLPGCVSQGENRDDALMNIGEAILLVVEVPKENQSPRLPRIETPDLIAKEIRQALEFRRDCGRSMIIETAELRVASDGEPEKQGEKARGKV